jgi:molybdenum cofactor cytidylyltransferase
VVVGHQKEKVRKALDTLPVTVIENRNFAHGISTSIAAGLSSDRLDGAAGAVIMLADMPLVSQNEIDRLILAFRDGGDVSVVRAVTEGTIGNPVILPRSLFGEARHLTGDTGARRLIERSGLSIIEIETGEAAQADVDTPEAVLSLGGRFAGEFH